MKVYTQHVMYLELAPDEDPKDFLEKGLRLVREPFLVWNYWDERPTMLWKVEWCTETNAVFLMKHGVLRFSRHEKA